MSDAKALDVTWFTNSKGIVGVAKVQTEYEGIQYRISPVDGFMEKMDVQQIIAWGSRFPDAAGRALFGDKDEG